MKMKDIGIAKWIFHTANEDLEDFHQIEAQNLLSGEMHCLVGRRTEGRELVYMGGFIMPSGVVLVYDERQLP